MQAKTPPVDCQVTRLQRIVEGTAATPPQSLARRLKLMIRRRLSPAGERTLKARSNDLLNRMASLVGGAARPTAAPADVAAQRLVAGDLVRVRSRREIEATLNHWRQLKGCTFMAEMARYCDTKQRVLRPLERFVDERDLRVKRARGIVLLEGVLCSGTAEFGRCDRSCYLFWREEWLQRLEGAPDGQRADEEGARRAV